MTTKQKPATTIRLGRVKAAVWANKTKTNGTRFNVTVCRVYKDGNDWKESVSFGRDELPLLSKVLDQAHSWIFEHGKDKTE